VREVTKSVKAELNTTENAMTENRIKPNAASAETYRSAMAV
jgi:hypothetical protein